MSMSKAVYSHRTSDGLLNIPLSTIAWLTCVNLAMFGEAIQNLTGFSYCDEAATLLLAAAMAARLVKGDAFSSPSAKKGAVAASTSLLLFLAVGFLGNLSGDAGAQLPAILTDAFTCAKFPIALIASVCVFADRHDLAVLFEAEAKLIMLVMFVLAVANLAFDFGMGSEARFGFRSSFSFVFSHPTYLVICAVGLSVVLMGHHSSNMLWIAMALFVAALSLRSKGIVYAAVCLFLLLTFGTRNKLTLLHVLLGGSVALVIGWDQYVNYYQSTGYARAELARQAFSVAGDYFPLGSGFATYGSAVTADLENYSMLYYRYGLSNVWGLAPGATVFLSDTFWPTVLGEFGWFGLLLYAACLIALFLLCCRSGGGARLPVVCCFAYLLISSTSESAFFNPGSVYLAMCIGIAIAIVRGRSQ